MPSRYVLGMINKSLTLSTDRGDYVGRGHAEHRGNVLPHPSEYEFKLDDGDDIFSEIIDNADGGGGTGVRVYLSDIAVHDYENAHHWAIDNGALNIYVALATGPIATYADCCWTAVCYVDNAPTTDDFEEATEDLSDDEETDSE